MGWFLSGALFYVAGLWSAVLFLVLAGLIQLRHRRRGWWLLVLALPVSIGVLWLTWFRDVEPAGLLNPWCKGVVDWLLNSVLFLFLPLTYALSTGSRPAVAKPAPDERRRKPQPARSAPRTKAGEMKPLLATLLFVLGWVAVWFGLAVARKRVAEIDYYSSRREYQQVLTVASRLERKDLDFASEARLHLALYHTGRLGEDIFSYRNQSEWDLLPGLGGGLDSCRAQSQTMLELGLVSEAEHLAHEALENEGDRPELLRLLARVNVLKGRPRAARVFLHALGQIPFEGKWANTCLQDLERNPRLDSDVEIAAIRPLMPTQDLAHQAFPAEGLLTHLLLSNPTNRMAFEYLMGEYLMNLQISNLVDRLWQLDTFGYPAIPRHYEEALLIYEQNKGVTVGLRGRHVRAETAERFHRFIEAMDQRLFSTEAGRQSLARDFGDTYWYYYFGRQSQMKQS